MIKSHENVVTSFVLFFVQYNFSYLAKKNDETLPGSIFTWGCKFERFSFYMWAPGFCWCERRDSLRPASSGNVRTHQLCPRQQSVACGARRTNKRLNLRTPLVSTCASSLTCARPLLFAHFAPLSSYLLFSFHLSCSRVFRVRNPSGGENSREEKRKRRKKGPFRYFSSSPFEISFLFLSWICCSRGSLLGSGFLRWNLVFWCLFRLKRF